MRTRLGGCDKAAECRTAAVPHGTDWLC